MNYDGCCSQCKHWLEYVIVDAQARAGMGACMRYPPHVPGPRGQSFLFPETHAGLCCGEFTVKQDATPQF